MAVPAAIWSGCGDDEGGGSGCTPNETQQCICSATVMGVQRCADDGASFEECNCSPAGTSGAGGGGGSAGSSAGSSGAAGGPPMQAPFTGATGLRCETDGDCLGGLTCSPSTAAQNPYGTGGVQGGICTSPCVQDAEGDSCEAVDSASTCLVPVGATSANGFCLPLCLVGQPSPQACGGRVDMACLASAGIDDTGEIGFCRPQCSSDVDCDGRLCDPGTGLCVDALPTRGPGVTGAACTVDTRMADCISGACLNVDPDGTGFCTAACVLGSLAGCGFSQDASPRDAACFPITPDAVVGDRGACVELCDVEADCAQDSYACIALTPQANAALGRFGRCLPPLAGADAGADAG